MGRSSLFPMMQSSQSPNSNRDRPDPPTPEVDLHAAPWVDLRRYDQSWFDRGRPGWIILLWWLVQAIAFPISPHAAHGIRIGLLRLFGASIGRGVVLRPTVRVTYPWKLHIGDYSWIGDDVVLYSLDHIYIGQHCVVSQKSYLCTGSHNIQEPTFPLQTAAISIGNGAWIATDCFIAPGVKVGANAVVGARSSVFSDLPAAYVCLGSPCKPHRPRTLTSEHPANRDLES